MEKDREGKRIDMNDGIRMSIGRESSEDFKCPYCGTWFEDYDMYPFNSETVCCNNCDKKFNVIKKIVEEYYVSKIYK